MRILFVGDVFGHAGRRIVGEHLAPLIEQREVDLVVVNAENAAGGFGVTPGIADELFDQGAHVLTTGNHVWDKREIIEYMQSVPADSHDRPRRVLRPGQLRRRHAGTWGLRGRVAFRTNLCGHQSAGTGIHGQFGRSLPRGRFPAQKDHSQGYLCGLSRGSNFREGGAWLVPGRKSYRGNRNPHARTHCRPARAARLARPTRPMSA